MAHRGSQGLMGAHRMAHNGPYGLMGAHSGSIIALLNRSTYHKTDNISLHPLPKSHGHPKSMNKLTLNEPARMAFLAPKLFTLAKKLKLA